MSKIDIIQHVFLPLDVNGMTLASHLAQMGQHESLQQLIDLGGSYEDAIYGYALAGHIAEVGSFLETCHESKKAVCTGWAIRGYARAGNFDCIYAIKNYRDYMVDFLIGVAEAGNKEKVTAMLDKRINLFAHAVHGYSSCNHRELLSNLITGTRYYPLAIYHAAHSGHTTLVNDLLLQCGVSTDYQITPSLQGSGDARSGTININAYSLLGHALQGYVAGRHFNDAAIMLARGASITQGLTELKDVKGLPTHTLYIAFLAYIKDATLRTAVIHMMGKQSNAMESLKITPSDIAELQAITSCMEDNHLNYVEACCKVADSTCHAIEGELTLPYLAAVMLGSSDLECIRTYAKPSTL